MNGAIVNRIAHSLNETSTCAYTTRSTSERGEQRACIEDHTCGLIADIENKSIDEIGDCTLECTCSPTKRAILLLQ